MFTRLLGVTMLPNPYWPWQTLLLACMRISKRFIMFHQTNFRISPFISNNQHKNDMVSYNSLAVTWYANHVTPDLLKSSRLFLPQGLPQNGPLMQPPILHFPTDVLPHVSGFLWGPSQTLVLAPFVCFLHSTMMIRPQSLD